MTRLIDAGLEQIANMVFRMGELAYKTLSMSLEGYMVGFSAINEIRNLSDTLVEMAEDVEDKVFEVIARFQPVASDLRFLKSYMKISYDLTRYGRYALDVSQIYEKLEGIRNCENWLKEDITGMSEKVLKMVRISIDSLKDHDVKLAMTLSETEKQVDEMYFTYLDKLLDKTSTTNICTISSVLVVRYLERIADHATYMGESIIYLATGDKVTLG